MLLMVSTAAPTISAMFNFATEHVPALTLIPSLP
jgi:hypothetical protein